VIAYRRVRSSGQSLAEFAIAVPVVLLLFMGVLDLGRGIYAINAVANAAREGSRTAIVNQTVTTIRTQAAQQATGLGIDASATGCSVGTVANPSTPTGPTGVCVEFRSVTSTGTLSGICPSPVGVGCVAVTTVKYSFSPLTPLISNLVAPFPITSTSKQDIESACVDPATPACPVP
jgi:Flp pilus assembly protein TadG